MSAVVALSVLFGLLLGTLGTVAVSASLRGTRRSGLALYAGVWMIAFSPVYISAPLTAFL